MNGFWFVYILESPAHEGQHYTGLTNNLGERLKAHNAGECLHSAKYAPWRIRVAIAFRTKTEAVSFERYLKSHSGRAFAAKHF